MQDCYAKQPLVAKLLQFPADNNGIFMLYGYPIRSQQEREVPWVVVEKQELSCRYLASRMSPTRL